MELATFENIYKDIKREERREERGDREEREEVLCK